MQAFIHFFQRKYHRIYLTCLITVFSVMTEAASGLQNFNSYANDAEVRLAIREEAKRLFLDDDYAALDRLATQYRKQDTRTPGGGFALAFMYTGFDEAVVIGGDEAWKRNFSKIERWRAKNQNSAFAHIAAAHALISYAWYIRGNGPAHTVKPENWPSFYRYIAEARRCLEQSKPVAMVDPEWYRLMVTVATAESWQKDETEPLVMEGLKKFSYYQPIYFNYVNFLAPKWHGSPEELEEFANVAVRLTRDKEGQSLYARICAVASKEYYGDKLFQLSRCEWTRMKKGFEDVLTQYPDPYNVNNFARFACAAADRDTAEKLLRRIGDTPVIDAWGERNRFQRCLSWVRKEK